MSNLDPDGGCPDCGTIDREHADGCTYEPPCDHESPRCPHAEHVVAPVVPLVHRLADERLKRTASRDFRDEVERLSADRRERMEG